MSSVLEVRLADDQLEKLADRIASRLSPRKPRETPDQVLLTISDVCERLQVGRTTIWNLRRAGKLEARRIGSAIRFDPADVESLVGTVGSGRDAPAGG